MLIIYQDMLIIYSPLREIVFKFIILRYYCNLYTELFIIIENHENKIWVGPVLRVFLLYSIGLYQNV